MKFYDREEELKILSKAESLKYQRSIMTVLIGRRRIGKTTLALQNYTKDKVLYFFISRKSEPLLCEEFIGEIHEKLGEKPVGTITKFEILFEYLLNLSIKIPFTLIIDEFQEFFRINESIYSSIQKLWDRYRDRSKIHLVVCGSTYSLMKRIYEDSKEPLFGRADFKINLKPFKISTIREILYEHNSYSKLNLLDWYIVSGGVAKYIELLILNEAYDLNRIIDVVCNENSIFLDEGKNRLIEEFGKDYTTYFSIMSLIANSKTSKSEIESIIEKNISGYLFRLEHDYNIIKSIKPINGRRGSKVQKYEIDDNFLYFWFRFIYKYRSLIEAENFKALKYIILRDIDILRGKFLEKLYIEIFKEQEQFTDIGSFWDRKGENEIDVVAVDDFNRKVLCCEVKLHKRDYNLEVLKEKSKKLFEYYKDYKFEYKVVDLEDIEEFMK